MGEDVRVVQGDLELGFYWIGPSEVVVFLNEGSICRHRTRVQIGTEPDARQWVNLLGAVLRDGDVKRLTAARSKQLADGQT